jgi:hypothetical protein
MFHWSAANPTRCTWGSAAGAATTAASPAKSVAPSSAEAEPAAERAYKKWVDPVKKSAAFAELEALMKERIIFIDGAMGTQIQKYKLQEADFRGERWARGARLHGMLCYAVLPFECNSSASSLEMLKS